MKQKPKEQEKKSTEQFLNACTVANTHTYIRYKFCSKCSEPSHLLAEKKSESKQQTDERVSERNRKKRSIHI